MKRRSLKLVSIVLAVMFCLSFTGLALADNETISEDNPFIGKWVFTGVAEEDGSVNTDQLVGYESLLSGVYYDFRVDGTCVLGMFGLEMPMTWKPGEEAGTAMLARRFSGTEVLLTIEDDHFVIRGEDGLTNAALIFTHEKAEQAVQEEEIAEEPKSTIVGKWTAVRIEDAEGNVIINGEDGNEGVKALLDTIYCDFAEDGTCSVFIFGLRAGAGWEAGEEDGVFLIGADNEGGGLIATLADGQVKLTDPAPQFPFVIVFGPAAEEPAQEAAEEPAEEVAAEEAAEEATEETAEEPAEEAAEEPAQEAAEAEDAEPAEPQEDAAPEDGAAEEPAGLDTGSTPEQESVTEPERPRRPWWW